MSNNDYVKPPKNPIFKYAVIVVPVVFIICGLILMKLTVGGPSVEFAKPAADSDTLPTDGDRIVLTGTFGRYDYDGIIALLEQPDSNIEYSDVRSMVYRVIVLDTPQTMSLPDRDGNYSSNEVSIIGIDYDGNGMDQYVGQHITFSIDLNNTYWITHMSDGPDGSLTFFMQPVTSDIHILD